MNNEETCTPEFWIKKLSIWVFPFFFFLHLLTTPLYYAYVPSKLDFGPHSICSLHTTLFRSVPNRKPRSSLTSPAHLTNFPLRILDNQVQRVSSEPTLPSLQHDLASFLLHRKSYHKFESMSYKYPVTYPLRC